MSRVYVAALRAVASQFDATAEIIDGVVRTRLARLAFGGAAAGRAHGAHGEALRAALDLLVDELSQWSRTSVEVAAALRDTAARYVEAEMSSAARIG